MAQNTSATEQTEGDQSEAFSPVPGETDQGSLEVLERALPAIRKLLEIVRE
ncbi:MAG: hypothetical protein PQJ59_01625 [Spirochaetales bacterium]|nr:hypothetical protein [Spirochaetales bacterium]